MGNAATSIATRVSGLTSEALEKELKGDLSILGDQKLFFNHSALLTRGDLNNYQVPGSSSSASAKLEDLNYINEEQMLCSMEDKSFIKERHTKVVQGLLNEIDLRKGEDSSSVEMTKKLQYLSKTYEALLRMDEREKRKSKPGASKTKETLNPIAKSGLSFGLSSLFGIIKVLGSDKPELYKIIIEAASSIVSDLSPMALNDNDPSISQVVSSVLAFFNSMLRRELPNIQEEDINACYSILFGLYVATGNLCTALALALTFANFDPSQDHSPIYKQIFPMLANFKDLTKLKISGSFAWETEKKGKGLEIRSDEPDVLVRTITDGWGANLSAEAWTEGVHYVEMLWTEGQTDYVYYGVCNGNYPNLDTTPEEQSFALSYKPAGGIFKAGNELYAFEKYQVGEKVGLLLDMDERSVLFFHNGKEDPKGPIRELPESMKLFMCLGGISKHKIVYNPEDMPAMARIKVDNYLKKFKVEVNLEDLNVIERAITTGEMADDYLQMKPIELTHYILKSFDALNDGIIEKLENKEKKVNVEKRMGLSLDIKNETVEILEKLALTCIEKIHSENVERESKEIYSEMLVYVLKLTRSHLIGSDMIPNATLERQLRTRIMKNTMDLINSMPGSKACEEATKIVTSCFSVFYKDPQEKLSYLLDRLKDQMDGVEISGIFKELEDRIFLEMARPDKLFPALELINDESQHLVETYFKYLIELSSEISKKLVRGEETSVGILKLLETSQIALFGQAAKSNFKGKWQEILMNYSLSVFQNCEEVLHIVKAKEKGSSLSDALTNTIRKTILADLLETLLYMLSLTRMSLDFLAKILPVLQSITTSLQHFDPKPKILNKGWALAAGDAYESSHNYDNSLDITHTVKINGARKYYLVFDPQCKTEKNCDYLELWKDDKKEEKLFRWDGDDFPKNGERVEVNTPYLFFTFHSDGSVNYWGWKIDIFGEIQADYYAKQWPDTTKDAAGIMVGFISVKLISGEFETTPEDEKVKALLQNPLLKYGISDKTLSLVKPQNPIPESLITLTQVPGIGEKVKPKMLNQFIRSDPTKKLVCNNKSELTLQEYIDSFGKWGDAKYSDNQFINDFIEGNSEIVRDWNTLKSLSGVSEEDSAIGGPDFDKAERAIFAVYVAFFEFAETFKNLLQDPTSVGSTVKYLVKDAVKYRKWADKYIQKSKETVSMTFEEVSKDVVVKCALLINSQHNQGLNELGITKIMKHLVTTVVGEASIPKMKKKESKWKQVKGGVSAASSLVAMLGRTESEDESHSEDVKEIKKISELILSLLETPASAEKIVDTIEKRRVKAMARALGLSSLGNLMSLSFRKETSLIRSFVDSLKQNNVKFHYWDSVEGIDSNLLKCIQKSFYNIYGYLQRELLKSKTEAIERPFFSHYLTVLDALCFPLKESDNLMIVEQQFPLIISLLLNWSKGYIGEEVETKSFLLDQCITGFKILVEADISDDVDKILLEAREGEGQNLYLIIEHKGALPVVDFQVTSEEIEGYENLGQFTQNGESKHIFIKKSEPSAKSQFLVSIQENLECEYRPYCDLLGEESEDEKQLRESLKDRLCRTAWAAYKLLVFSAVGNVSQSNSVVKQTVQDLFLNSIFNELKWDQSLLELGYSGLKLNVAVSGELWVNKMNAIKAFKKNPMQEWVRQFNKETEKLGESMLKETINDLIAKADPAMKGVLTPAEISKLDPEISELLSSQDAYKNSKGNFDFFKYINSVYAIKNTLSKEDQYYIEHSKIWTQIPEDFEQAALSYDFCNLETIYKNIVSRFNPKHQGKSFQQLIDLFELTETKGIVQSDKVQEDCPAEFKNEEGNLDLYVAMHAIAKDQNKFFDYYHELKWALLQYDDLPNSCLEVYKEKKSASEYMTSLLWTIYGCLGSSTIVSLLAREEYLAELLKITFLSSAESNFALGSRILKAILPSQHSPQTLGAIWTTLPHFNSESTSTDFVQFLLKRIGKMTYWYGFRDAKSKLFRCGYEALVLLKELMNIERWRGEVLTTIMKSLNDACQNLRDGKALPMYQVGAIEALAILSKQVDIFGNDPIELAEAKLINSKMTRCIIRAIDGDTVNIYSPVTDETVSVNTESIAYLRTINNFNAMKILSQDELQSIKDSAINLWFALIESEFLRFNMKSERTASFRTLYAHLENVIVNAITLILKKKEISDEEGADLLRSIMKHAKAETRVLGNKEKQLLIKQILKTIAEKYIYDDFTDEEIMEMFSNASDKTKYLIEELTKENILTMIIAKCLDKGIKDKNGILEFAGKVEEPKSTLLFKLQQIESIELETSDIAGYADIYQNSSSQFVIENSNFTTSRKEITTVPDLSVFRNTTQFVESLTILAQLEGIHYQNQLSYGLKLGGVDIGISTSSGSPSFEVNGSVVCPAKLGEVLAVRVYLNPNGEIRIINENTKETIDLQDTTTFNGLQMGAYGLYMEAGTRASLLTFEVYDGKNTKATPTKVNKSKEAETYKTIKVTQKSDNYDRLRLKLLGLTEDQITQALSSDRDLRSSLDYVSQNFPNAFQNTISSLNQDVITELKLVKTIREVPNGFTAVPIYEDGKQKEFNIPKRMILCAKKEQVTTGSGYSSIALGTEAKDHIDLGNFDPEDQASDSLTHIWVKQGEIEKSCIKDIIFIKSSSMYNVKVPFGYKIIKDEEGNAINLGHNLGKKSVLFLAAKISDTALNCALTPFKKMILAKMPLCGLLETAENNETKVKDDAFDALSIQELFSHYYKFMDSSKQVSYKNLALMLIKKCPTSIATIALEFSITKLFDFLGSSINKIAKKIDTLLSQDNPKFKDKLFKDCLERMLRCLIYTEKSGASLSSLTIESPTHPYDNNMDLDQEIRIPGAKKLKFVFDPQCKTESGCDPLRFYKNPGRVDEIKCISGEGETNWAQFEVDGEVVYTYFHSDGSVNYWGYKFEVIPEGSSSVVAEHPWPAMWVLNKISSMNPIPKEFMEITHPRCVQPIFLHSLSANNLELKLDSVRILNKIIRDQKGPLFKNILNILIAQANELHNVVSSNKAENSLMQATARLLEDASHKFQLTGEELWFMEFCELVSDIKGLSEKDGLLETFLFESFKKNVTCNLGRTYESKHPYIRQTTKEFIQIPGASFISIVFDSNSNLDPRDTAVFSYDEFGKKLVEEKKIEAIISEARWREEPCGSKVTFSEENSQVTRVKGSGWGNAIWSEDYSDGTVSIKFKIESDGDSDYWYIGVYRTAKDVQNYDLNEYIGCDCPHDVWSWKKTGEVHKKGWFKGGFEGFKEGDEITMFIDMNLRELTFFNGALEVFKFTGIASSVTPVICFGSLNQVITVLSVERMAGSKPLSERNLDIIGDSVYYWIPVHKTANIKHVWDSNQNGAALNANKTTVTKSTSDKTYHETEAEMRNGKYYIEVSVESKGYVGVGFTKKSLINENTIEGSEQTVIYYSNGKLGTADSASYDQNDVIGSYIDFDKNEIAFYKNEKLLDTVQVALNIEDSEDCFKFIAVLSEENQSLAINNSGKYPAGVDLMKIDSEQETELWGYQFSLTPNFKGRNTKLIDSYLSFASAGDRENWRENYKPTYSKFFKDGIAQQFIEFMNGYLDANSISFDSMLSNNALCISPEELIYYPDLQKLSEAELFNLKEILFNFCSRFQNYFYLFDLHTEADEPENSLMKFIKKAKYYLLSRFKKERLENHLDGTKTECRIDITIDKAKAQEIKAKGEVDHSATASMFSQISRALGAAANKTLRHPERMFKFAYKPEGIQDDAGKYNELLTELSKELQSPLLPLLIPSQNNVLNVGNGRDNWMINPTSTLPAHMHLFTTLGKFFGSAIRTKLRLRLSLPVIVFKHLLYENVTTEDLRDFDFPLYKFLHKLRNLEAYGITADNFGQQISEKFIVKYGEEVVELCEGGANIDVTFENAAHYADLLEKHKLFENPKAYDSIRKGVAAVVPIDKLNLFTAAQLRELICLNQEVKLEVLEENTVYENCRRTDPHIENFWEAIKSLKESELAKFIDYIARRSKITEWDWPLKFTIAKHSKSGAVNTLVPIIDNTIFRLELPAYTSPEIMKEKIIFAISHNSKFDSLDINI
ncbi:unnamed protein product [Blepharisma stoltei]|uniref:B30.2/SPRY domain-containing protein n=1 Tax=Blepharisma stoltei TaxID=1481888 RepID=A0AAU9JS54_9CILI|nr:unnamed protein product [Blepharisma stoltei]